MKLFKVRKSSSSLQVFNEAEELIGVLLFGFIGGFNEKIKIGDQLYKIKSAGFLWRDIHIFDQSGRLVFKTDSSKNRILYYGSFTEIYTYEHKGWLKKKLYLYDNKDRIMAEIRYKQTFFLKEHYSIETDDDFSNDLIILSVLYFYYSEISNG
ncbi:hypothetical protein [Chryseobacterium vrystaatense]|uniref:Uncharacterized protein n=1 Tax=Chryseobacterium vrystaatense TaxID=307480 RepID=A0ABR4UJE5_9FLAO|nr:hypothetical protein [Chryseobacterium vrystaatense]KFF24845.1 hypothetical protein IW16_18115 [Chryseobacterium vrystaatense]